jgi:hypothetical protein
VDEWAGRTRQVLGAAVLTVLMPTALIGQERSVSGVPRRPATELLAMLRSGVPSQVSSASGQISAAFSHSEITADRVLRGNYEHYTDAERRWLLDGVEGVARGDDIRRADASTSAIGSAFSVLGSVAFHPLVPARERDAIPERVLRIYREATHHTSRHLAAMMMGRFLRVGTPLDSAFLGILMSGVRGSYADTGIMPVSAVIALTLACEAAMPALRQLEAEGIAEFYAFHMVRQMAAADFSPESLDKIGGAYPPCSRS